MASTRWTNGVVLLAAVGLLGGCASTPYYLVESKLVQSTRYGGPPDVTETPAFQEIQAKVKTLGLRPPDVCADQGLSGTGGATSLKLGVLRTRCGVEMAELERALARASYSVVSWNAIQNRAAREAIPPLDAAESLGVDVLLQVNALERVTLELGRDLRWERRFYHASDSGVAGEPASVERSRADHFEELIREKEEGLKARQRVGATINVSAVQVGSGASIWFYEWTRFDDESLGPRAEVLVRCDELACAVVPEAEPEEESGLVSGTMDSFSVAGDPADEAQAIFHDLVRALVTDLAERFAGRTSDGA